jgi:hypothetical protein
MKPLLKYFLAFTFLLLAFCSKAASILIPMDEVQKNHLKSYGIAFWILKMMRRWTGCLTIAVAAL